MTIPRLHMTTPRLILLATVLVAFTMHLSVAEQAACPEFFPQGKIPALLNPKLGQRVTMLFNTGYAVATSGVTHGTLWCAEHLTAAGIAAARDTPRAGAFHADHFISYLPLKISISLMVDGTALTRYAGG